MPTSGAVHTLGDLRELYCHAGFFVVRSALAPFAELAGIGGVESRHDFSDPAERRSAEVARLSLALERPEFREAIFFASARLDAALGAGRGLLSFELTLAKYVARSCARATPFGVFAGISIGSVGLSTRLVLGCRESYRRYTRPSLAFLGGLMARAAARAEPGEDVKYEVNPSAYRAFESFRFSRDSSDGNSHPVVEVKSSQELERALARCAKGASLAEIAEALAAPGAADDWALDYARALVDHRVLLPSCLPAVTGPPPIAAASRALETQRSMRSSSDTLAFARERLEQLDGEPLGSNVCGLREVAQSLNATAEALGFECSDVLQADLIKPAPEMSLGLPLVESLLDAAALVQRTGAFEPDPSLSEFCERFTERFGTRCVPLVEALDAALGIPFGAYQRRATDALIHGLGLESESASPPPRNQLEDLKLALLTRALAEGALEVALDRRELERWPRSGTEPLPESFAVLAQLGFHDGRTSIVSPVVLGPSGIATLARFCHAVPELERGVRNLAALEQTRAGKRLLADVAYLPLGHVGNILSRPSLRAVEVCYGGKSGASEEQQLAISDLDVSVVEGRVQLYSRRLDRPIAIRIGNAYDHGAWQNLPIYRFLGAVEAADRAALAPAWSWGPLATSPFLPRVVCGDVVLTRARWWLGETALAELAGVPSELALEAVQALRARLRLPRWVTISGGETPLVTDLESALGSECFVREVRRAQGVLLEELLPAPDELAVEGPEGKYASEVVVPFVLRHSVDATRTERPRANGRAPSRARSFAPGSEWLYAKVYAGPPVLDSVAQRVALQLVPSLPEDTLSCWFFVPYADPEPHLRLRFRGDPGALLAHVLPALQRSIEPDRATGAIYRLQLDTYERELERYGGELGMERAEQVFHWDSEACARVLAQCAERPELRWSLALLGVERLLNDFVPELEARVQLVASLLAACRRQLSVTMPTLKAIGSRYRARVEQLTTILWPECNADPDSEVERARALYSQRSKRLSSIAEPSRSILAREARELDPSHPIASLVHMHVVRLLGTRARSHELVMYDFIHRQYASRRAKAAVRSHPRVG